MKKYTDEALREAVANTTCLSQVSATLGLAKSGSSFRYLKENIERCGIDISHWTGRKVYDFSPKSIEYYLELNGPKIRSALLKEKLIEAGLLHNKCYKCGIIKWQDQPAPLDLEHINGNHHDNRLFNLIILCPNCHRLTNTWGNKKR